MYRAEGEHKRRNKVMASVAAISLPLSFVLALAQALSYETKVVTVSNEPKLFDFAYRTKKQRQSQLAPPKPQQHRPASTAPGHPSATTPQTARSAMTAKAMVSQNPLHGAATPNGDTPPSVQDQDGHGNANNGGQSQGDAGGTSGNQGSANNNDASADNDQATGEASDGQQDGYAANVQARVRSRRSYGGPLAASGVTGTVVVAFTIDGRGRLKSVRVTQSSGNVALDRLALDQVRAAAPFARPPRGKPRDFQMPLTYRPRG